MRAEQFIEEDGKFFFQNPDGGEKVEMTKEEWDSTKKVMGVPVTD